MDTSFDEWLSMDDMPESQMNYCDEENGIFWGEYTETERQYVDKLAQRLTTPSEDNSLVVSQIDDHSIYDGMVPKEYSILSSIEPMNISENMSPFVSSFGSSLPSKDSPQKTPIVQNLSETPDITSIISTPNAKPSSLKRKSLTSVSKSESKVISDITPNTSKKTTPKETALKTTRLTRFASTLATKDSPQKTPIVEKLSETSDITSIISTPKAKPSPLKRKSLTPFVSKSESKIVNKEILDITPNTSEKITPIVTALNTNRLTPILENLSETLDISSVISTPKHLLTTRSENDSSIVVSQIDDHSIYDEMVPKDHSIISSIEAVNISENMSPFVSSFGSSLTSKDSPQKTPIRKLSETLDTTFIISTPNAKPSPLKRNSESKAANNEISDITPNTSKITTPKVTALKTTRLTRFDSSLANKVSPFCETPIAQKLLETSDITSIISTPKHLLSTCSESDSIVVSQTDDHSIYDEMVPKDHSIISSIEAVNISENMSPFVPSFGSSLPCKDSPQKTPIVQKLSETSEITSIISTPNAKPSPLKRNSESKAANKEISDITPNTSKQTTPKVTAFKTTRLTRFASSLARKDSPQKTPIVEKLSETLDISSSIETVNVFENSSPFVSFGSSLPSYVSPQKTPIVQKLTEISDISSVISTPKHLLATPSENDSILVSQIDDHSIYDEMVPKDHSITSSIEPMNFFETTSPFDSSLPSKDSPQKTQIIQKLSESSDISSIIAKHLSDTLSEDNTDVSTDVRQTSVLLSDISADNSYMKTPKTALKRVMSFPDETIGAEITIDCRVSDGIDSSNVDFDNLVEMKDNLIRDESTFLMNDSINICTNEDQIQNYCLKPSQEKHILDQTIEMTKFESTSIFDNSIEVNAKDLLSPFCLNKLPVKSSAEDIPVTTSLVRLDTPTVRRSMRRSTVGKVESTLKSKILKLRLNPLETSRETRSSTQYNSSLNESTLDFILNEIKCNTEDTEEFLTKE